jgi:hypothetical protein
MGEERCIAARSDGSLAGTAALWQASSAGVVGVNLVLFSTALVPEINWGAVPTAWNDHVTAETLRRHKLIAVTTLRVVEDATELC